MFRLFSLFAILAGPSALMVFVGSKAFGNRAVHAEDNALYAIFQAFPSDTAYAAPIVAVALIVAVRTALRVLGFAVSIIGGAIIIAMIMAVFLFPEWADIVRGIARRES